MQMFCQKNFICLNKKGLKIQTFLKLFHIRNT